MSNILVTGATGNIGVEVIRYLYARDTRVIAGVRNIDKAKALFYDYPRLEYRHFDFENTTTFEISFKDIDRVFLLRPPHISDIEKYFTPLLNSIKQNGIDQVVFLSVQGAEKSKLIPHHKIERLIKKMNLEFIFLRPSYFMQNLTTTLLEDIRTKKEIVLPAGKAKFNWVDIKNIGETGAILLEEFEQYKNNAYDITGLENENFYTIARLIRNSANIPMRYRSVNPLKFYSIKKRERMEKGKIIVMTLLHFLPRFQKEPAISDFYHRLTAQNPTNLKSFIEREKSKFKKLT